MKKVKWFIVIAMFSLIISDLSAKIIENESFSNRPSRNLWRFLQNERIIQNESNKSSDPLLLEKHFKDHSNLSDINNSKLKTFTNITLDQSELPLSTNIANRKDDNDNENDLREVDYVKNKIFNKKLMTIANLKNDSNYLFNKIDARNDSMLDKSNYINYRKTYGIRYDPEKIKRALKLEPNINSKNATTDLQEAANIKIETFTKIPKLSNSDVNNVIDLIETSDLTTTFSSIIDYGSNFTQDGSPDHRFEIAEPDESRLQEDPIDASTNIMKSSKIRNALQTFRNQLKQFFHFGANTSPHMVTEQRFLNLFNVIKFDNVQCSSTNQILSQLNGTCYHEVECRRLGGIAIDRCADGFGVCCIFQFGCGGVTQQEISYFKSQDFPAASQNRLICSFTIELLPSTQQVLVEFLFFELKPPVDGSCMDDQFVINGQSLNYIIPIFCGVNTGQHIYIDVESSIERKIFLSVLTASAGARAFNIKITQLQGYQAPQGCLQYYTEPSGIIETFNYSDESRIVELRQPSYYNNLNYAICIKRGAGFCTITYSNEQQDGTEFPFQLVNVDEDGTSIIPYGQAGAEIFNCGDDFISINGIRLCGEKLNDGSVTENFAVNAIVTDYSAGPIILPVRTNDAVVGRGFRLGYDQQSCQQN